MRWIAAVGLCIGLLNMSGDERGLPALVKARRQAHRIERDIAALKAENATLRARAEALRHDARTIELVAREKLGMARASELVLDLRGFAPQTRLHALSRAASRAPSGPVARVAPLAPGSVSHRREP